MKIQLKQPININKIATSGQCFRFTRTRSGWLYGDKPICQLSPTIIDFEYPELFDTETPYGEIEQAMLSRGGYWARCAQTGRGLMILNQPVFETILSFIISQIITLRESKALSVICAILHSHLEMSCWIGQ